MRIRFRNYSYFQDKGGK